MALGTFVSGDRREIALQPIGQRPCAVIGELSDEIEDHRAMLRGARVLAGQNGLHHAASELLLARPGAVAWRLGRHRKGGPHHRIAVIRDSRRCKHGLQRVTVATGRDALQPLHRHGRKPSQRLLEDHDVAAQCRPQHD